MSENINRRQSINDVGDSDVVVPVQIHLGRRTEPGEADNSGIPNEIFIPYRFLPNFTEWGWWYIEPERMNRWYFDCTHIGISLPFDASDVVYFCVGVFPKYRCGHWAKPVFCGCARCEMISHHSPGNRLDIAGLHYGADVLKILEGLSTQGNRNCEAVFYQVMLLPSFNALTWWRRLDRHHGQAPNALPSIHFWSNRRRAVYRTISRTRRQELLTDLARSGNGLAEI